MSAEPRIIPVGRELPPMRSDAERARLAAKRKPQPKPKRKHRDRFGDLNAFVDCSMGGLKRSEALTWLVLWRDTRNGTACTSSADVARRIGSNRRTVIRAIGGLHKRKLLTIVRRGGQRRGPSVYRVHPIPGKR